IEQDADVVLFLYRPSYYKRPEDILPEEEDIAKVIIGKQRNGPVGQIEMLFQKEYTRFRELTKRTDE
ncbi:MAG: DnaB-like helicase C-terminal domain-containing protein, partial [Elusimicrobiota bacterium]